MPPKPKVIRYFQASNSTPPQVEIATLITPQSNVPTLAVPLSAPLVNTNCQQERMTLSIAAIDGPPSSIFKLPLPQLNESAETSESLEGKWTVAHPNHNRTKDTASIIEGNKGMQ
jgi:hypothetical protein